jgi:hypothetical protein
MNLFDLIRRWKISRMRDMRLPPRCQLDLLPFEILRKVECGISIPMFRDNYQSHLQAEQDP